MAASKKGKRPPNAEKGEFRGERAVEMQGRSVESRKRKKTLREVTDYLLTLKIPPEAVELLQSAIQMEKKEITADEAIVIAQIVKAVNGDTSAAAWVRDTAGEKPGEKVDISTEKPFEVNIKVIE